MKTSFLIMFTVAAAMLSAPTTTPTNSSNETIAVSPVAFAIDGTYEGTMPCHFCTGIRTVLELGADRSFELVELFEGSEDSTKSNVVKGTYQIERGRLANSRAVVIKLSQPTSVSRYIEVISDVEIRMLDQYERPFDVGQAYSLYKR